MKIVSSFSARLAEAMDGMGVTELASKLGVSKQSVSAYLKGTRQPKQLALTAIAQILSVEPAWLMGYDVEKYVNTTKNKYEKKDVKEDKRLLEFIELFSELTDEQQSIVIAQIKGILSNK